MPPRAAAAVLIGRNGTNKSTLLRAIAVGTGSRRDASAMLSASPGSLVGPRGPEASVTLTYRYPSGTTVTASRVLVRDRANFDDVAEFDGPSADELDLLVCGYGAGRGITGSDSGRNYQVSDAAATLFDYRRELLAPELTLRRLADFFGDDDERFHRAVAGIARAMGLEDPSTRIVAGKGGGVLVTSNDVGVDVPLEALADGYRVAFNWIMDVYGRALKPVRLTPDGSIAALILVDEIDQHLHPDLQTRVIGELGVIFPRAQLIVSTHSPLVVLGAHPSQLVVLTRNADGSVSDADRVPDYRALTPDDLLADDRLFDVQAHNPEFAALLDSYEQLAAVAPDDRSPEQIEDLRKVASAVRDAPRPGLAELEMITSIEEISQMLRRDDRG